MNVVDYVRVRSHGRIVAEPFGDGVSFRMADRAFPFYVADRRDGRWRLPDGRRVVTLRRVADEAVARAFTDGML